MVKTRQQTKNGKEVLINLKLIFNLKGKSNQHQKSQQKEKTSQSRAQTSNKNSKKQKLSDQKRQASPVRNLIHQKPITNQEKVNPRAQTTTLPKTVHSKLKEAYTNIENPLAYTGDANKLLKQIKSDDAHAFMNQIKSFKYVTWEFLQ